MSSKTTYETMNDIKVTIRFERAKEDLDALQRILKELDGFEAKVKDKDEGRRLVIEELQRRLRQAGLKVG